MTKLSERLQRPSSRLHAIATSNLMLMAVAYGALLLALIRWAE